ncbi:UNVERIFIED_CONTAM: hypothetical protein FKN15_061152 [Acipenser sinensis]
MPRPFDTSMLFKPLGGLGAPRLHNLGVSVLRYLKSYTPWLLDALRLFKPVQRCLQCHTAPETRYLGASTPSMPRGLHTSAPRCPQGLAPPCLGLNAHGTLGILGASRATCLGPSMPQCFSSPSVASVPRRSTTSVSQCFVALVPLRSVALEPRCFDTLGTSRTTSQRFDASKSFLALRPSTLEILGPLVLHILALEPRCFDTLGTSRTTSQRFDASKSFLALRPSTLEILGPLVFHILGTSVFRHPLCLENFPPSGQTSRPDDVVGGAKIIRIEN